MSEEGSWCRYCWLLQRHLIWVSSGTDLWMSWVSVLDPSSISWVMGGKSLLRFKAVGFSLLSRRLTVRVNTCCSTNILQFLELWYHIYELKNNIESLLNYLIPCLSIQYGTVSSQLLMISLFIYDQPPNTLSIIGKPIDEFALLMKIQHNIIFELKLWGYLKIN